MGNNVAHLEADLPQLVRIDEQAAVKDERRLGHVIIHGLPIDLTELLPLCRNYNCLLLLARLKGRVSDGNLLLD